MRKITAGIMCFIGAALSMAGLSASENMLKNSSFELGTSGYSCIRSVFIDRTTSTEYIKPELDTSEKIHGNASLRFDNPNRDIITVYSHELELKAGKQYTLSVWMKSDTDNYPVQILFNAVKDRNWNTRAREVKVGKEWKQYYVTGKVPEDGYFQHYNARLNFPQDENTAGKLWIDAIQFTESDKPQDYSPCADVEAASSINGKLALYAPGKVDGKIGIVNYSKDVKQVSVDYQATDDYFDKTMASESIKASISGGAVKEFPIQMNITRNAAYELGGKLKCADRESSVIASYFAVCPDESSKEFRGEAMGVSLDHGIFQGWRTKFENGMNYPSRGVSLDEECKLLSKLGVRWLRAWAGESGFTWARIEPEEGKFDWRAADMYVNTALKHKMRVLPVLGSHWHLGPPNKRTWGRKFPKWLDAKSEIIPTPFAGSAARGDRTYLPNIECWENYVRAIVSRYKGKITHYEILNEPNLYITPECYTKYLKVAYETAKKADPTCTIVSFCVTGDLGGKLTEYLEDCLKLGAGKYADVVSFHPYSARLENTPVPASKMITDIWDIMKRYNVNTPLWNSELYYLNGTVHHCYYATQYRANALSRRFLIDLAGGLSQSQSIPGPHIYRSYPIERNEWREKTTAVPGSRAVAYNAIARLLEDGKLVKTFHWQQHNICHVFKKDNRLIAATWCFDLKDECTIKFNKMPQDARIMDLFGNEIEKGGEEELSLLSSNDPWYIACPAGKESAFLSALENVSIEGRTPIRITGARISMTSGKAAIALEVENTTGKSMQGMLNIEKISDWIIAKQSQLNYGPIAPYSRKTVLIPVTLKETPETSGEITVNIRMPEMIVPFTLGFKKVLLSSSAYAEKSPVIDGKITDGEWAESESISLSGREYVKDGKTKLWQGNADCSGTFTVMHDKDNLYIAAKISDDIAGERKAEEIVWSGDAVEIFLDMAADTDIAGEHYHESTYQLIFAHKTGKYPPRAFGKNQNGKINMSKVKWLSQRTQTGYEMEIAIPLSVLGGMKQQTIGFDMAIDDSDKAERDYQLIWSGNSRNCVNRSAYGRLFMNNAE